MAFDWRRCSRSAGSGCRVVQLRKKGIRERLVPKDRAPGQPYDFGRFELAEEPWPENE